MCARAACVQQGGEAAGLSALVGQWRCNGTDMARDSLSAAVMEAGDGRYLRWRALRWNCVGTLPGHRAADAGRARGTVSGLAFAGWGITNPNFFSYKMCLVSRGSVADSDLVLRAVTHALRTRKAWARSARLGARRGLLPRPPRSPATRAAQNSS